MTDGLLGILVIGIIIVLYFLPTLVAGERRHRQAGAIFVVNLFVGWTLLGWVIALAWACTSDVEAEAS